MQKFKKPISILLVFMMIVSLFAIVPITASAEELMETISFRNEQEVRKISGTHFTITPHADEGILAYGCWDFDGDYPDAYAELSAVYGETITKLVFHIDTGYDNYPIVKAGENKIAGSQSGDLWTFDNVNASSVRISANPNYEAEGKEWWCFDVFELDVYFDASNAPAPSDIVQELIDAIGTVTLTDACKEKIDAARSAYDNLSQADQALVNNYKTLTDAEAAYQGLVDQAAADRAIAAINAIGTFESTPQYKVLFDRANNTYNGLTDAQKALVTNYDVLVAARTAAEDLPYVSAGNFGGLYWAIDKDGVMTFAGSGETDMKAFRNNSSIRKVIINSSVTRLKSYTFGNCYNLTEVEFRNSNPKIDNFVFAGCGKLSKVTLAEGLTKIGYNMFNGCGALHELNLPRSVNYIETEAFDGSGIQTLRIPYGLGHAVSALKGMGQLTTLMIDSDTSIAYTSGDFPDLGSVTNVYVPAGSTFKTQDSKKWVLAVKEQYLNDYSESDFAAAEELFNMSMYDYGNDPEYAFQEVIDYDYDYEKYEAKEVTVPGKDMTLTDGAQVAELFGAATIRTYTTAVSSVEALIDAIGTVELTDECKEKIDAARAAYEELSDVQKAFISNETLAKLEAAEDAFVKVSVTWKNDDGTVLKTEDVAKGATPTYNGATPTKAEDANYTYTFSGWTDGTNTYGASDTLPAVTGDITYPATFDSTKRSYTITWKNDDGSVIDTTTVEYGETPTHDDPEKAEDEQYTYTFAGWTPEIAAVTGDAEYTATFDSTKRSYTITWKNDDGSVIGTTTVEYGETPTHDDPEKAEDEQYTYTFAGWTPEIAAVTGDAEYTATYTATDNHLNGPQDDGYFYLDDVKQLKYQLIKWNGDYYFINDYDKYAKNNRLYLGQSFVAGSDIAPGYYTFGADGKMVVKNGPQDDGYFYINNAVCRTLYRFVEFEGNWYFIYDGYKYAKNAHLYLSGSFLNGTDFEAGYYDFDADGKLNIPEELPNGANEDGYFYINGVKQTRYQLIKYGNDFYFINDGDQYAKNTKLYLSSTYVAGTDLPAGLYEFGADGKMIISALKNGPQDDGYFYINGARQNAYQLVNYEGDYYFINDGHKIAKNARLYLGSTFLKGTDFAPGYYVFGADGKMVTD